MDTDTNDYVGRPAFLTVVLNETGEYSNIENIAPLPTGLPITVPDPLSPLIRFNMDPWDEKAFEALPEWAQEKVKKSTEWQKEHAPVTNVSVQGQTPAAFQMPQNIPGIDFQAYMAQASSAAPQTSTSANISGTGGRAPF